MFRRVVLVCLIVGLLSGCQTARVGHTGLKVPVPSLSFIGLPWPGLGEGDLEGMAWENAFVAMKGRMQHEYPFTEWKGIDWDALEAKYRPRIKAAQDAKDDEAYYLALREFLYSIPDGHVGISDAPEYRLHAIGGGYGFALVRLDDGRVIACVVDKGGAAEKLGMKWGAELLSWNGRAMAESAAAVSVLWAPEPPATPVDRVREQYRLLTRAPVGTKAHIAFKNPGESAPIEAEIVAYQDRYVSLELAAMFEAAFRDESDPFTATYLPGDIGYVKMQGIGATLSAPFPERAFAKTLQAYQDRGVKGMILDLRRNRGGSDELAAKYCGYFFGEEQPFKEVETFSEAEKAFAVDAKRSVKIVPAQPSFTRPVVVLIDSSTLDAGEGIAAALKRLPNVRTVGDAATHASFATTGGGMTMPKGHTVLYPIGRALDAQGKILLESDREGNGGVTPDVRVETTQETVQRRFVKNEDVVLERGQQVLAEMIAAAQ